MATKMAKAPALAHDDSFGERVKAWPERIRSFYHDVRTETKKVTSPTRKEVQATTIVVIVTVFLFGFYFWIVDLVLNDTLGALLQHFNKH